MSKTENNTWGLSQIWNKSLENLNERELSVRNHLWASELGKAPVDNWLKMRAIKPTNPPNARSLRKFEAGNVFEWIVSLILKRAGILTEPQKWMNYQYDGLVEVTGKADFIAGGKTDIEKWEKEMDSLNLPEVFLRAGEQIISYLAANYPDGLKEMPLEIKSVSAFMFEALERKNSSAKIHRIQTYHYLKAGGYDKANIIYICRDDLRIMEFPITSQTENEYREAIEVISKYHLSNVRPPIEKEIVFDPDIGKFAKNFNVAYSGYLKMLYGYKDQKEFDDANIPTVSRWNRVLGRIKSGAKMTAKNEEVKKEIEAAGFNLSEIIKEAVIDDANDINN